MHSRRGGALSKEELETAVRNIDEQIQYNKGSAAKLHEREQEYGEVQSLLQDLPQRLTHPIMVPFGPLAFFPGQIEHTNEVLTQLSSEWFVLRRTEHALGLVRKRQERLRKDKDDVARELRELELRRRLATGEGRALDTEGENSLDPGGASIRVDEDGFMDIREPYLEEQTGSEGASRTAGAPSLDERDTALEPEVSIPSGAHSARESSGIEDTLARLRELERLEEQEALDELAELDVLMESCERIGEDAALDSGMSSAPSPAQVQSVPSPADLFNFMQATEERADASRAAPAPEREKPKPVAGGPPLVRAFPGAVSERLPTGEAMAFAPGGRSQLSSSEQQAPPEALQPRISPGMDARDTQGAPPEKRVSKFKADRQRARG